MQPKSKTAQTTAKSHCNTWCMKAGKFRPVSFLANISYDSRQSFAFYFAKQIVQVPRNRYL